MIGIIHIAGPMVEGIQKCERCGAVLIDYTNARVLVDDTLPGGWPENDFVTVSGEFPIQSCVGRDENAVDCAPNSETVREVGKAVRCTVCRLRKKPIGRSAPLEMANSLCDSDCPGYRLDPYPGQLWPGETQEDFGY